MPLLMPCPEIPVSVIIATQNRAHYLDECFHSIAAQLSPVPFEVIVIDNASSDGTAEVIKTWCARDDRFRAAHEPRIGQSVAKNLGLALARGKILLFTDDDVILDCHWVRSYWDFFANRPDQAVIAGGPVVPVPHDLKEWPHWFGSCNMLDVGLLEYGPADRELRPREYLWGNNMAVPRTIFQNVGPWDAVLGHKGNQRGTFEDIEFQDRVEKHDVKVWFCARAVVQHRLERGKITPRRVMSVAFIRGGNKFLQDERRQWGKHAMVPKAKFLRCGGVLMVQLSLWLLCALAFRLIRHKALFERASYFGNSSGWWITSLCAGRTMNRLCHLAERCTLSLNALVLRLLPER